MLLRASRVTAVCSGESADGQPLRQRKLQEQLGARHASGGGRQRGEQRFFQAAHGVWRGNGPTEQHSQQPHVRPLVPQRRRPVRGLGQRLRRAAPLCAAAPVAARQRQRAPPHHPLAALAAA